MSTLGPFTLLDELGRGGMARVWRARLAARDATVALKVMSTETSDAEFAALFEREVQAAASLDHPGIIQVLDSGIVQPDEHDPTRGIDAGAPWLAMELASGGSLEDHVGRAPFSDVHRWLAEALEALGHAHARGVLHRDIKPANLLLSDQGDLRPGLKLSDFGIARLISDGGWSSEGRGLAGTPIYMAPELFENDPNELGPWTDLYALGCVAHELVAGTPPFTAPNILALVQAHVVRSPPPLPARDDVPAGFQEWVARLLAKQPHQRFQRAEEALAALQDPDAPTLRPTSWAPARETEQAQRLRLLGIGLGLVGVRPVPLVGRGPEQKQLQRTWARTSSGTPQAVILRGAPGMGRTRLARWLGEHAWREGAEVLVASFVDEDSDDPLRRMVTKSLRVRRVHGPELPARIRERLDALGGDDGWLADALTAYVAPEEEQEDSKVLLHSRTERWGVLRAWLERLGRHRPVVLVLDDVDTSLEATLMLDWLVQSLEAPLRLLIVATISDGRRTEAADAWERLYLLAQHDAVTVLPLRPLDPGARRELVQELLGLEPGLARQVEERSGGSPFFAVQLVADQVRRGVLVPGPRGFRRADGAGFAVPDDVHSLWRSRVDLALQDHPPRSIEALEALSVLGAVVDHEDWEAVCRGLGVDPSHELLRELIRHQLVSSRGSTWTLAHALLGESLQRNAREHRRLGQLHSVAADVLARRMPERTPARDLRIGRHLLDAGRAAEAFPMITRAPVEQAQVESAWRQLEVLAGLAQRAADRLHLPEHDSRVGELMLLRLRIAQGRDDRKTVQTLALSIAQRAQRQLRGERPPRAVVAPGLGDPQRWWALRAEALRCAASATREAGQPEQALELFRQAQAAFDQLGDDKGLGWCALGLAFLMRHQGELDAAIEQLQDALEFLGYAEDVVGSARALNALGDLLRRRGEHDRAVLAFEQALALAQRARSGRTEANCRLNMGQLHLTAGRLDQAVDQLEQARRHFERTGSFNDLAPTLNTLGEAYRLGGDLERAAEHYGASLQLFNKTRPTWAFMPRANLALVELQRGRYAHALQAVRATRDQVREHGRHNYVRAMDVLEVNCLAGLDRWDDVAPRLPGIVDALTGRRSYDRDVADALARTGRLAESARRPELARTCWMLAGEQFEGLDDPTRAAEARAAAQP